MKLTLLFNLLFIALGLGASRAEAWMPTSYWSKSLHLLAGGLGGGGNIDGTSGTARFNLPNAIAADSAGNFYVADTVSHTIRKITSAGVVTTLAGTAGSWGSADGTGSAARFSSPRGVAVDSAGNVYVADTSNYLIRQITAAGVVTTLAGTAGTPGTANGTGSAARFNLPNGIAVDAAGDIFVADTTNHSIRKVTPAGVVTTLAGLTGTQGFGNGTGTAARFNSPTGMSIDAAGNIYVADTGNNGPIRKVTSAGVVTTLAGAQANAGSADGTGAAAQFNLANGTAVDASGNVYVADTYNHTIRKITSAGVVTTFAGTAGSSGGVDGTGNAARFSTPGGITADSAGNLYVADTYSDTIRKITTAGVVTTFAGSTFSDGNANGTGSTARFNAMYGVAPGPGGLIYVADASNSTIRKITSTRTVTTFAGTAGATGSTDGTGSAARFYVARGVTADSAGNVYVADTYNYTVRKITAAGVVTTLAGTAGSIGNTNGTGSAARFGTAHGIAVNSSGDLYVADTSSHTIRMVTSAGVVTTLAGTAGSSGTANGTGGVARFNLPKGIAVDSAGNMYVADTSNHAIRKVTAAGVVTTLAGNPGSQGSVDGTGTTARFKTPEGVAVDADGNVYVADTGNNLIRKVTAAGVVTTVIGHTTRKGVKLASLPTAIGEATNAVAIANGRLYIVSENSVLWCPKP